MLCVLNHIFIYKPVLTSAFCAPLSGQEVGGEHVSLLCPAGRQLPARRGLSGFCLDGACHQLLVVVMPQCVWCLCAEPPAGGGVPGPTDQHPAAAGGDAPCAQLGHVHHGGAHVLPHVLQLSVSGGAAHEAE